MSIKSLSSRLNLPARCPVASTETGAKGIVSPRDLVASTETGARVSTTETGVSARVSSTETGVSARVSSTETGVSALAAHQDVSDFDR